jgi:hypothetical protein
MKWYEAVAEMKQGKIMLANGVKRRIHESGIAQAELFGVWLTYPIETSDMRTEWTEYIEPFKVGDWVQHKLGPITIHIKDDKILKEINFDPENYCHATPEEIAQEQEHRKWTKWNRKVGEYRKGDIVLHNSLGIGELVSDKSKYVEGTVYSFNTKGNGVFLSEIEMICPVEMRVDKEVQAHV